MKLYVKPVFRGGGKIPAMLWLKLRAEVGNVRLEADFPTGRRRTPLVRVLERMGIWEKIQADIKAHAPREYEIAPVSTFGNLLRAEVITKSGKYDMRMKNILTFLAILYRMHEGWKALLEHGVLKQGEGET